MSSQIGATVSHYRLERRLGAGGMGEVYLARDTQLDRHVAIKFLIAPDNIDARRRLLHEARAVASLDHPGICAVYEVGTDPAGGDFIVMQYVEGETLARRLVRGRLTPDEALTVGAQVADALAAAQRRGIVHRDLKPQNIILTTAGSVKLLDFGLATRMAGTAAAANAMTASGVTHPDRMAGTPAFMAPEQVRNQPSDFRTDIFSLGCVLYECLTGHRAFSGATPVEIFGRILHVDPPPPSSVASGLGEPHDALCARMLAKAPEQRFQSAEEALGAFRTLVPSLRVDTASIHPPPVVARFSVRTLTIALAVIAISVTAAWYIWRVRHQPPEPPAAAAQWYDRGVEAMRDGSYAAALASFNEAVTMFGKYAQAYFRMAEANIALDDERSANAALLRATSTVDISWLSDEDQRRFEAARASVLRDHPTAIASYRALADLRPGDAGRWLDLGRAEEAAGRRQDARREYARAVELDPQYAPARLRLGVAQARAGETDVAFASFDEALRLYRAASNTEGATEAILSKGVALSSLVRVPEARELLDRVMVAAAEPRYASQRIRAELQIARLLYLTGHSKEAEDLAVKAHNEAVSAGLQTLAAGSCIEMANVLVANRRYVEADAELARAIDLASSREAIRVEMRARLQQASLRLDTDRPAEALTLSAAPMEYFSKTHDSRLELSARNVAARAHASLEHYDDANRLANDVLKLAEGMKDESQIADALETLRGQVMDLGRLPDALSHIDRILDIHRRLNIMGWLPFDLANRAEALILLGRRAEAEADLAELDRGIASGLKPYLTRRDKVAVLRGLQAAIDGRHAAELTAVAGVKDVLPESSSTPTDSQLLARVLREHALAYLGRSRTPATVIARWPDEAISQPRRREVSYWVADTLAALHNTALARTVAQQSLDSIVEPGNPELGWRLAVMVASFTDAASPADRSSFAKRAQSAMDHLAGAWSADAATYFARPDLQLLKKRLREP